MDPSSLIESTDVEFYKISFSFLNYVKRSALTVLAGTGFENMFAYCCVINRKKLRQKANWDAYSIPPLFF